jgi:shikimate dehydrogenase
LDDKTPRGRNSEEGKRVLLLGRGISGSLSPAIQNAAFEEARVNAQYEIEDLERKSLGACVSNLKSRSDVIGLNVTVPFKEEILPYLDAIDSRSRSIGAVNTVMASTAEGLSGYNTDYDGILATLERIDALNQPRDQAIVLGAGGASRACVFALLESGYTRIDILNRTPERAERLAAHLAPHYPRSRISGRSLSKESFVDSLENCDLVINTIPESFTSSIKLDFAKAGKDTLTFDLSYKGESSFMVAARSAGLLTCDGLLMLVVQAAESFEIWTGKKAPFETMMLAANNARTKE